MQRLTSSTKRTKLIIVFKSQLTTCLAVQCQNSQIRSYKTRREWKWNRRPMSEALFCGSRIGIRWSRRWYITCSVTLGIFPVLLLKRNTFISSLGRNSLRLLRAPTSTIWFWLTISWHWGNVRKFLIAGSLWKEKVANVFTMTPVLTGKN